ncbi:MAG: NAD(P)H-hydrate dehydratase [Clostridia bacterium]|nr:NAD(P)H-hydrate dehydratase [Clostridia bacterium]
MKVLNTDLIRKSEQKAVLSGAFSFRELMYIAGSKAYEIINAKYTCTNKKVAVICGCGNNGGDGFVIAQCLYENGADVKVFTPLGLPTTEDAKYYYEKLSFAKFGEELDEEYDIIIDAVFGIGLNRAPNKELTELFGKINESNAIKVSVDIPSGVCSDTGEVFTNAVNADLSITFIALKPCFVLPKGSDFCGEVIVADIGVEPVDYCFETIEKPTFKKRLHNSHKGTFGTALIIAGSYGMAGAAMLCSKAALRSGVGIAKCVLCESIYPAFTSFLPEAVCIPAKQTKNGTLNSRFLNIENLCHKATALLFGCGVGTDKSTIQILKKIIKHSNIPTIIDADGINCLSQNIELLKESKAPIILTPHPAEMARLCNTTVDYVEQNRITVAKNFAEKYNCTVILKGANTITAFSSGKIFVNTCGNQGMATGGSGDVLAGVIVSLLAQGFDIQFAVNSAVYLHSHAGDKAALKRGIHAILPSDIIEEL